MDASIPYDQAKQSNLLADWAAYQKTRSKCNNMLDAAYSLCIPKLFITLRKCFSLVIAYIGSFGCM